MNEIEIKEIRNKLGLSQEKFASLIAVDRRTIINYEQGKKIPDSKVKLLNLILEAEKTKEAEQEELNNVKEEPVEPSLFQNENFHISKEFELNYISKLEAEIAELKRELFFYKSGGKNK